MILNFSSADLYEQCKHKYWLRHVKRLRPPPIVTLERGHGGHAAISHFHKTHDVHAAVELAEAEIRDAMKNAEEQTGMKLLPEELIPWERAIVSARTGVQRYAERYAKLDYTVIRTEVEFLQPIPGTEHHCPVFHDIAFPDIAYTECECSADNTWAGEKYICWRPHYLTGFVDAVISMNGFVWVLDQKFSGFKSDLFFESFKLDMQGTIYCWGLKEATGIEPRGFIINKIGMPWKNQPADKVEIDSEPYLREHLDYVRMTNWAADIATEIEQRYIHDRDNRFSWRVNPRACNDYNRQCWFHSVCLNHDEPEALEEFVEAPLRYHDLAYYKLLLAEGLLVEDQLPEEVKCGLQTLNPQAASL